VQVVPEFASRSEDGEDGEEEEARAEGGRRAPGSNACGFNANFLLNADTTNLLPRLPPFPFPFRRVL